MAPFYGWGSTASRLVPLEEVVYFLPLSSQIFLVLILSSSEGWKAALTLLCPFPKISWNMLTGHWSNVGWETFPGITPFLERQKKRARCSKSSVKTYNCLYKHRTILQSSLSLDTRHQHQTKSSLMSRLPPGGYGKNWARIMFTLRLIKMFYF